VGGFFSDVMLGIGHPSARMGADGGLRRSPTIVHPPVLALNRSKKKPFYPFRSLLSTTAFCGCHFICPRPERGCNSASLLSRAPSGAARSPLSQVLLSPSSRARRPPGRAKTGVGGAGACAPLVLVRPPAEPSPVLVVVVLTRRRLRPR
jgi:hypothetical protein